MGNCVMSSNRVMAMATAAAMALAVPAAAQERATPVAARPSACTAATAEATTIAAITAAGDAMIGRCVSVEGLAVGRELHADNTARYRQRTRYNDPSSTGAIIGLYGNTVSGDSERPAPARVRVVGRVDSCDRLLTNAGSASGPDNLVMVGGYCHYFGGLAITAEAGTAASPATGMTTLGTADIVRIPRGGLDPTADPAAGPALGNLSPMAAGAVRDRLTSAGLAMLMALARRDIDRQVAATRGTPAPPVGEARVTAALRPFAGTQRSDQAIAEILRSIDRPTGPWRALNTQSPVRVDLFGWREPLWADADTRAGAATVLAAGTSEGVFCASAAPNAEALWPIDERDADNAPGRPYACMRMTLRPDGTIELDIPAAEDGAREP